MTEPTAAAPVCYRHTDRETWIRCQRCERPICPDCMNSASVGFQCPSCVKEGKATVRSARLPYGGNRASNPALVTYVLIGINIAVWLAIRADGGDTSLLGSRLALIPNFSHATDPAGGSAILVNGVAQGSLWQLITSAFTHIAPLHIALNMMALYFLGPPLEQILGRVRYLTLYLVAAITGAAGVMLFSFPYGGTVGASGAIFGLFGALAVVTLKLGGDFRNVLMLIGINLALTFTIPGISWQGHLGGLLGGTLVGLGMVYAPKDRRSLVQFGVAGLVLAASLSLILIRVHSLMGISPGATISG